MKPYYEDGAVTIYHGDSREILPSLPKADLLLTDPPYGIAVDTARATRKPTRSAVAAGQAKWAKDSPAVYGDDEPFDPTCLLGAAKNHVIFGANHFAHLLPPSSCWIVWDKKRGGTITPGWNSAHAELAWSDFTRSVRVFSHLWDGYKRDTEIGFHVHPTQKPVALMRWIIETFGKHGDLILDPYMGSGPVARAALETGRRYIGIEIEERYCEIAAMRCAEAPLPLAV